MCSFWYKNSLRNRIISTIFQVNFNELKIDALFGSNKDNHGSHDSHNAHESHDGHDSHDSHHDDHGHHHPKNIRAPKITEKL